MFPAGHPQRGKLLQHLVTFYDAWGRGEEATQYREQYAEEMGG